MIASSNSSSNPSNIVNYPLQCALGISWCWMASPAMMEPREGDRSADPLQHFNRGAWDWWSNPRSRVHPSANSAEHVTEAIWMEIALARHTPTPLISVWERIVLFTPGDPLCLPLMVLCLGTFRSTVYGLSPCWRSALTKVLLFLLTANSIIKPFKVKPVGEVLPQTRQCNLGGGVSFGSFCSWKRHRHHFNVETVWNFLV